MRPNERLSTVLCQNIFEMFHSVTCDLTFSNHTYRLAKRHFEIYLFETPPSTNINTVRNNTTAWCTTTTLNTITSASRHKQHYPHCIERAHPKQMGYHHSFPSLGSTINQDSPHSQELLVIRRGGSTGIYSDQPMRLDAPVDCNVPETGVSIDINGGKENQNT